MKFFFVTLFFMAMSNTILADTRLDQVNKWYHQLSDKYGNAREGYNEDKLGVCYNTIVATQKIGSLKDEGLSRDETRDALLKDQIVGEYKEMHLRFLDKAYSPEHLEQSGEEFAKHYIKLCEMPEGCAPMIKAASIAHRLKQEGWSKTSEKLRKKLESMGADLPELVRAKITDEEGGKQHRRVYIAQAKMVFWPEHANKSAEEYDGYIADVWCDLTNEERAEIRKK